MTTLQEDKQKNEEKSILNSSGGRNIIIHKFRCYKGLATDKKLYRNYRFKLRDLSINRGTEPEFPYRFETARRRQKFFKCCDSPPRQKSRGLTEDIPARNKNNTLCPLCF